MASQGAKAKDVVVAQVQTFIQSKKKAQNATDAKKAQLMGSSESNEEDVKRLNHCSIEESVEAIRKFPYFSSPEHPSCIPPVNHDLWTSILNRNMNLCFYGIGDKAQTVEGFVKAKFADRIQVKIKGTSPGVKIDSILMKLVQVLEPFANNDLHPDIKTKINKLQNSKQHKKRMLVSVIKDLLESVNLFSFKVVLVFHDIDGRNFREYDAHHMLSDLVGDYKTKEVLSLVATISNCNFPSLLSDSVMRSYNFAFLPMHTFEPNAQHMAMDEVVFFNKRESKNSEEIRVVYEALTENQKEILRLLAQKIAGEPLGQITYEAFYDHCVDEMVVSSETQLAESLKEAIGHGVVHEKIGDQGVKLLKMPNAAEALQIFLKEGGDDANDD